MSSGKRRTTAVLFASLAMAIACSFAPRAQAADKAVDDYNFAVWLFNTGKYGLAVESYQGFLKNFPEHEKAAEARFGLAQSFFLQDKFKEAAEQYEAVRAATPAFPQMPEVLFQLGQCLAATEQFDQAAALFAEARAKFPEHYLADWALAREAACMVSAKKYKQAEEQLTAFLGKYAPDGSAPAKTPATQDMIRKIEQSGAQAKDTFLGLIERSGFYLALAQLNQDRLDDARKSFEAFLKAYPDNALRNEAQFRLAQCLYRQNAFADAAEAYGKAAEGKGEFADVAAFERGLALHKAGKVEDAANAFADMASRFPESPRARKAQLYSGTFLFDVQKYPAAIERLKPLADAGQEAADEASYWIGMCLLKTGKAAEAEQAFDAAMQKFPQAAMLADMLLGQADARLAQNKLPAAAEAFSQYAQKFAKAEQAPRALYSACLALHRADDYAKSDALCNDFLGRYGDSDLAAACLFLSGENRFLANQFDRAVDRYADFLKRKDAPADRVARAHFRLAWIHRERKRYDQALEEIAKIDRAAAGKSVAAESDYLKGVCLYESGKLDEATPALEAYLKSDDTSRFGDDAVLKLAMAEMKGDRKEAAAKSFARFVREHPKSELVPQAEYQMAECLYDLKQYDKAGENYKKVAERTPATDLTPYALFGQALCHYDQSQWAEAADIFGRLAESFKESPLAAQALYRRGRSLVNLRKWTEAADAFQALLTVAPKHELARGAQAAIGTCLQEQKKWADAAAAFQKVVESYPAAEDQPRMLYELAWSWREAGNTNQAMSAFERLADRHAADPLAADAYFYLAENKYRGTAAQAESGEQKAKRLAEAQALYEKVLSAAKDQRLTDKAVYRIGWCQWLAEKFKDAAATFDRLAKDYPQSELVPDALFQAGQAYAKAGEPGTAVERFDQLIGDSRFSQFQYLPEAMVAAGENKLLLGKPAEAARQLAAFLSRHEKHPSAAQAHFVMGRALYDQKDYKAAIESFSKVPELTRGETAAQAQFYIGQSHQAMEDYKSASVAYLRVQALYGDFKEWLAASTFENGKCYDALGNKEEARKAFQEVVEQFKGTKWASLAAERLQ